MTNLFLAAALAMSPKVASHQAQAVNVPLVQTPITVTVQWINRQGNGAYASNLLAITPLAGGATQYFALPVTNRAQVTATSNSVSIMVAAIGVNGIQSDFSNAITNNSNVPYVAPLSNVRYVIPMFSSNLTTWQKQTNMAWSWTQPGYWRLLTATNL